MMNLANQLTLLRILLSPVFLYLFASPDKSIRFIAFVIYIIAALTDWYDGVLARKYGFITRWGQFLDPLADKVLTSFAFFAFLRIGFVELWMFIIIVIRDIGITLLRSYAELKDKPVVTAFSAKVKTLVQMTVIFYTLLVYILKDYSWFNTFSANMEVDLLNPTLIYILMLVVTILTAYTGLSYLIDNRKTIREIYVNSNQTSQ
jgi:CDP-diacylglycerol--glycerol-3-phosphate 3-phosphatidyltransferase